MWSILFNERNGDSKVTLFASEVHKEQTLDFLTLSHSSLNSPNLLGLFHRPFGLFASKASGTLKDMFEIRTYGDYG